METEHYEALESMGHDHYGSGREARALLVDDEDVLDDTPLDRSYFYFLPTYTDTMSREDITPELFVSSHEEDHVENIEKRGKNADGDRRFHRHVRASRESHENTDERNGDQTEMAYERDQNPEGSNHYSAENRRGENSESESLGNTHDDFMSLATRYRTSKSEPSQEKDRNEDNKDNEGGNENVEDDKNEFQDSEGNLKEIKPPGWDEDGEDNENREVNKDNKGHEDNVDVDDYKDDEDKVQVSGDNFEETDHSDWDEDAEDNGDEEDNENSEDFEDNEDNAEVESQDSGGNFKQTGPSDWDKGDEDNSSVEDNENSEYYEDIENAEDDENDEDEFQDSGGSFEETEASDWDETDEDDFIYGHDPYTD